MKTIHKWTKGDYKIATNPNCRYLQEQSDTRQGYMLGKIFGIDSKMWSVTHLPTGLKMPGYFSRLRDAKFYVTSILPLTDWLTLTVENSTERLTPIKQQILNAIKE
jgi:hypothetical protein